MTTTVGFGSTWLTPRISRFIETYPDIDLSIICEDRELDLGMREADVAIRMGMPTQPDVIKLRLFTVHTHLYASPHYLAARGTPARFTDLDDHDLIVYGDLAPPTFWIGGVSRSSYHERWPVAPLTVSNDWHWPGLAGKAPPSEKE